MTDTTVAVATTDTDAERARKGALLKAIGLDKAAPEQRELAVAIAKRYDLDLLLKHLVLIEGRPFITRDGQLWVAHRSGQLDGMHTTDPEVRNVGGKDYWTAICTVWRKDMSHPFTYSGRYPTTGGNVRYAPEMAVKVAESMALRRAFNISVPSQDERWDQEDVPERDINDMPKATRMVVERARARQKPAEAEDVAEAVYTEDAAPGPSDAPVEPSHEVEPPASGEDAVSDASQPAQGLDSADATAICGAEDAKLETGVCTRAPGHTGAHRSESSAWPQAKA